jgi:hypothetical protein
LAPVVRALRPLTNEKPALPRPANCRARALRAGPGAGQLSLWATTSGFEWPITSTQAILITTSAEIWDPNQRALWFRVEWSTVSWFSTTVGLCTGLGESTEPPPRGPLRLRAQLERPAFKTTLLAKWQHGYPSCKNDPGVWWVGENRLFMDNNHGLKNNRLFQKERSSMPFCGCGLTNMTR